MALNFPNVPTVRRLLRGASEAPRQGKAVSEEEDRRVWLRHPSAAQAVIQPVGDGVDTRLSARVRNVSRGGINLLLDRPLQPGGMISIELPGSTPQKTSTVLACVIHVRERAAGEWSAGCAFSESLSDPDLETFGARRQNAAAVSERVAPGSFGSRPLGVPRGVVYSINSST